MSLTLYTKNNCSYCLMAKSLLKGAGIEYNEVNIEEVPEARDFVINAGHKTMPQIYKGAELFVEGGYAGLSKLGSDGIKQKLNEKLDVGSLGSL
jgi:glutaredoxin